MTDIYPREYLLTFHLPMDINPQEFHPPCIDFVLLFIKSPYWSNKRNAEHKITKSIAVTVYNKRNDQQIFPCKVNKHLLQSHEYSFIIDFERIWNSKWVIFVKLWFWSRVLQFYKNFSGLENQNLISVTLSNKAITAYKFSCNK